MNDLVAFSQINRCSIMKHDSRTLRKSSQEELAEAIQYTNEPRDDLAIHAAPNWNRQRKFAGRIDW